MRKYPVCECGKQIRPGDPYSVIDGELYCYQCEEEILKNTIEDRFNEFRGQLEEIANIPIYFLGEI